VFQQMLGMTVTPDEPLPLDKDPAGQLVGSVGFTGKANGVIHIYTNVRLAQVITSHLLGITEAEVESDMINDAMGELSNMVVGNVKSKLCDLGWTCVLTVPSIVRGHELTIGSVAETTQRILGFRNCEHRLITEVMIKES
jgi:chemotaxis protein CheX